MNALWIWPAGLGLLGLILGSFIATVAVRWADGRRVSAGRSECDSCGKILGPHELVPVLSFAVQGGTCRGCGARIALAHPAVELLGLLVGVVAGLAAPGWEGAAGSVFGWLLLALAAIDLSSYRLPNVLTGALAMLGLALAGPPLDERLIGGALGFAILWLVAAGYRRLRGREGLGGGDPKLFGAIGCWLGWQALPTVLLAACMAGLAWVLGMALAGKRMTGSDRLPFGTLLAPAAFAVWIFAVMQ